MAEVFRSGIESVHPSQWLSAHALALSRGQTLRHVVVPQAVRRVVPPLLNDFVSLQKDTALVASVSIFDALFTARDYANYNFNYTPYVVVACFFVAMTVPLARLCDWLAGRVARRERAGGVMSTPVVEVRGLRKAYGDRVVLDDVSLTVEAGDVVCLIGSSGSGKSTLLRCLDLLEDIDDGVIEFEGREISDPLVDPREVRQSIGMVFQAYNLFPHLSVLANCTLAPRKVHGTSKAEAEATARELLDRFGLGEHVDKHPDRLSGGQQQRAALVRALCTSPRLLLLDEITAALDPELVGDVLDIVRDLAARRHDDGAGDPRDDVRPRDRHPVCFLDGGRIIESGPPEQVLVAPEQARTREFLRRVLLSPARPCCAEQARTREFLAPGAAGIGGVRA